MQIAYLNQKQNDKNTNSHNNIICTEQIPAVNSALKM